MDAVLLCHPKHIARRYSLSDNSPLLVPRPASTPGENLVSNHSSLSSSNAGTTAGSKQPKILRNNPNSQGGLRRRDTLEAARQRILSPKSDDRRDALEKLWDAFERLKTLEPGADKRAQADALLDRVAAPGSGFRQALGREAAELTKIGNSFRIRHSETTQEALTSLDQIDYLFIRMFAFVRVILKGTSRGG